VRGFRSPRPRGGTKASHQQNEVRPPPHTNTVSLGAWPMTGSACGFWRRTVPPHKQRISQTGGQA